MTRCAWPLLVLPLLACKGAAQKDLDSDLLDTDLDPSGWQVSPALPVSDAGDVADVVAAACGSTLYTAWREGSELRFSRSTDAGSTWSSPVRLDVAPEIPEGGPSSAILRCHDEVVVALWADSRHADDSVRLHVNRSVDAGVTWLEADIATSSYLHGSLGSVISDGDVHQTAYKVGVGIDLVATAFAETTDGGLTWSNPVRLNPDAPVNRGRPGPAIAREETASGTLLTIQYPLDDLTYRLEHSEDGVTWGSPLAVGSESNFSALTSCSGRTYSVFERPTGLFVQVLDDGAPVGEPAQVFTSDGPIGPAQIVAGCAGGRLQTVFASLTDAGSRMYAVSEDAGGFASPVPIDGSPVDTSAGEPGIAVRGAGVAASWVGSTGAERRLHLAQSPDAGATWSPVFDVEGDVAYAGEPALVWSDDGVFVFWVRSEVDDGSVRRVVGNRLGD